MFQESYATNDIPGSMLCLKSCLQRGRLENVTLYKELNHYLELLIHRRSFDEAFSVNCALSNIYLCN